VLVVRITQDEATINQNVFACDTLNPAWASQRYSGDEELRGWKKTVNPHFSDT